eukprot:m.112749 g.112749  ORF g.112749 m.112749 type:complete len:51 (+) comp16196_c0_seq2:335-487(+)
MPLHLLLDAPHLNDVTREMAGSDSPLAAVSKPCGDTTTLCCGAQFPTLGR